MHEKHAQYIGVEPITSRHFSNGAIRRLESEYAEKIRLRNKYDIFIDKYGESMFRWILDSIDHVETVLISEDRLDLSKKDADVLRAAIDVLEGIF